MKVKKTFSSSPETDVLTVKHKTIMKFSTKRIQIVHTLVSIVSNITEKGVRRLPLPNSGDIGLKNSVRKGNPH